MPAPRWTNVVRPFLAAGVGSEKTKIEGGPKVSNFGWNAGAGFRWFLPNFGRCDSNPTTRGTASAWLP